MASLGLKKMLISIILYTWKCISECVSCDFPWTQADVIALLLMWQMFKQQVVAPY